MNTNRGKTACTLKALLSAVGIALAVASTPAFALITWGTPFTLFEDDDVDFLVDNDNNGVVSVGDSLVSALELNQANGVNIGPGEELTGIAVVDVLAFATLDANGVNNDIVFGPSAAFAALTGLGQAGGVVGFWRDNTPDLVIDAGSITAGTPSCTTQALCLAQARDGILWQVDGFNDPDDYWVALNAETNVAIIDVASPAVGFGQVNGGLSILFNGTGENLVQNMMPCAPFCGPGGDGMVDIQGSGSIKGGGEGLIASEWFATSDFDLTKKRAGVVPEPGTLALIAAGLFGAGAAVRRRRN